MNMRFLSTWMIVSCTLLLATSSPVLAQSIGINFVSEKNDDQSTLDEARAGQPANYVAFTGITASDFTVTFNGKVHRAG